MNRALLIVESNPNLLGVFGAPIHCAGYDVLALGHPRRALEAASFRQFQVALVDMNLPEMEGLELVRHLTPIQHCLQVVMLASSACPADGYLPEEVRGWFVQPCKLQRLEAAVERAFQREPALAEPAFAAEGASATP